MDELDAAIDGLIATIEASKRAGTLTEQQWVEACDALVELIDDCEPLLEYADFEWIKRYCGVEQ